MMSRIQVIALSAFLVSLTVSLQGCSGAPPGECADMEFEGGSGGVVAAAIGYADTKVTCKDGEYTGPQLSCNWVGVNCFKALNHSTTCGIVFAFGKEGSGLSEWPPNVLPRMVDSKDKLPTKQFTTEETGAEFAKSATKAAARSISQMLYKAVDKMKVKAAEVAAIAKKKAEAAAAVAKKKAASAAASAKAKFAAATAAEQTATTAEEEAEAADEKVRERRLFLPSPPKSDGAEAIDKKKLKCVVPSAKGQAKEASRLFVTSRSKSVSAISSSEWMMPCAGVVAFGFIALAAWKIVTKRALRARVFDRSAPDRSDIDDEMLE